MLLKANSFTEHLLNHLFSEMYLCSQYKITVSDTYWTLKAEAFRLSQYFK